MRTDQGVEYVDRTPYYPWDCAWESAASLCARLAGAVCAPLSILPPAAFAAHALALRAALRRGGGEEEAAPKALVDDANDLWRPASAVWFLACSVFMMLGARDACRAPSARGAARAARSRRRGGGRPRCRRCRGAGRPLVVRANAGAAGRRRAGVRVAAARVAGAGARRVRGRGGRGRRRRAGWLGSRLTFLSLVVVGRRDVDVEGPRVLNPAMADRSWDFP